MAWIDLEKAVCGEENTFKQYVYNTFRSSSQFINSLFGGDPDETISGATGKASLQGNWWYVLYQEPFLDAIFGEGHCFNVIEWDRGVLAINKAYDKEVLREMGYPQVQCLKDNNKRDI